MKKIAILQSNYIPWKGYFDMIAAVDEFILYEDAQFTKNDWRNRNKIKTPKGIEWLSIPVGQAINRRIRDVELTNSSWQKNHWKTLCQNYKTAPFFKELSQELEPSYCVETHTNLSSLNKNLIQWICSKLSITTKISQSWDYDLIGDKTEKLVNLCKQAGANTYISGPSASSYSSFSYN